MTAMIVWIVLSVYAVGWFFSARVVLTSIENDDPSRDTIDRALMAALSCIIALFWPAAGPVYLVMRTRSKSPRELKREIEERDKRIAELERELGMDR